MHIYLYIFIYIYKRLHIIINAARTKIICNELFRILLKYPKMILSARKLNHMHVGETIHRRVHK